MYELIWYLLKCFTFKLIRLHLKTFLVDFATFVPVNAIDCSQILTVQVSKLPSSWILEWNKDHFNPCEICNVCKKQNPIVDWKWFCFLLFHKVLYWQIFSLPYFILILIFLRHVWIAKRYIIKNSTQKYGMILLFSS